MSLYEQTRQEFVDLLKMKANMAKYSSVPNKEIMKTDVEWMNLSDLARCLHKAEEVRPENGAFDTMEKKEAALVEPTLLDLKPVKTRQNGYEEFDSESD